jgi:hypothetical protein
MEHHVTFQETSEVLRVENTKRLHDSVIREEALNNKC